MVGDLYLCESEGNCLLGAITKRELNQLGVFVSGTAGGCGSRSNSPETRLHIHRSFPEFMQTVFWPAVRKGWMIVGFNLAFDSVGFRVVGAGPAKADSD